MPSAFDPQPGIRLLLSAFEAVHSRNVSTLSFEELYRAAYLLTINRHAPTFIEALGAFWRETFAVRASVALSTSQPVLSILSEAYMAEMSINHIADVLMYLDKNVAPVRDLGKRVFREAFLTHSGVKSRLRTWLREAVLAGPAADRGMLQEAVKVCIWTETYESIFESLYIDAIDEKTKFHVYNKEYIAQASDLVSEQVRFCQVLRPSTLTSVLKVMDKNLTLPYISELFAVGLSHLLAVPVLTTIRQLYELGSRTAVAMTTAATTVRTAIVSEVAQILGTDKDTNEMVLNLIECRRKYQNILSTGFGNVHEIATAVKQGFEAGLSDPFVVQILVRFVDDQLRSGTDNATLGPDVIALYRHVPDKDYFELLYRQQLGWRLLNGKTANDAVEVEKTLVSLIKCESGAAVTSRMEAMFADGGHSARFNAASALGEKAPLRILTLGIWPFSARNRSHDHAVNSVQALLPMLGLKMNLLKEYQTRFQGRKLMFIYNQGTVDLKFALDNAVYFVTVSPIQALILLLVETKETPSFADIRKTLLASGRPEEDGDDSTRGSNAEESSVPGVVDEYPLAELKRHLLGLYHNRRCLLLTTTATGSVVNDEDRFSINSSFEAPAKVVRVPLASVRLKPVRTSSASVAESAGLDEDRKHVIESAVVRVMKSRKTLDHNTLIAEIIKITADRFKPSVGSIKARIENLIEREFIKRSDNDVNTYDYVA